MTPEQTLGLLWLTGALAGFGLLFAALCLLQRAFAVLAVLARRCAAYGPAALRLARWETDLQERRRLLDARERRLEWRARTLADRGRALDLRQDALCAWERRATTYDAIFAELRRPGPVGRN